MGQYVITECQIHSIETDSVFQTQKILPCDCFLTLTCANGKFSVHAWGEKKNACNCHRMTSHMRSLSSTVYFSNEDVSLLRVKAIKWQNYSKNLINCSYSNYPSLSAVFQTLHIHKCFYPKIYLGLQPHPTLTFQNNISEMGESYFLYGKLSHSLSPKRKTRNKG